MEKCQSGLRFHPGCWRMEKREIIWIRNAHFAIHIVSFLFKLFPSFPYVNIRDEISARAEISPCNQPLTTLIWGKRGQFERILVKNRRMWYVYVRVVDRFAQDCSTIKCVTCFWINVLWTYLETLSKSDSWRNDWQQWAICVRKLVNIARR